MLMPYDTRIDTSPYSSNQKIKALEKVTIDAFLPLQQTILPILNSEGADYAGINCIDQKTRLNWDTVTCEDVTIELSTSLPSLGGRLPRHAINGRMACLSALLILAARAWSMEPKPSRI